MFSKSIPKRLFKSRLRSLFLFCTPNKPRPQLSSLELDNLQLQPNPLRDLIKQQIRLLGGYMKFSRYWSLCLTHPEHGYYSSRNAFSTKGDFTTSPEISSLFGEAVAAWLLHFLESKIATKSPKAALTESKVLKMSPFRIIELGPGRGLLMADILGVLDTYKCLPFVKSINFIEASSLNSKEQQDKVLECFRKGDLHFRYSYDMQGKEVFVGENSQTKLGWFKTLQDLMQFDQQQKQQPVPTLIISNEFFDALPVNPLVFQEGSWREKVIRVGQLGELQLNVSPNPVSEKFAPKSAAPEGSSIQLNYESMMIMESLSKIVQKNDGAILTFDYGNDFTHNDSIRAIRDHKYIDNLRWVNLPGLCDLSAYVDFSALKAYAEKNPGMVATEAIPQGYFLQAMGINVRVNVLSQTASAQKKKRLQSQVERLTHPSQMGEIYKVQMVTKKENEDVYPFVDETKRENVF